MSRAARHGDLTGFMRVVPPRIVALIYTGGTAAHLLRLAGAFTWRDVPFFVDWVLVILGPLGAAGLVWLREDVLYRGWWEKVTHWLIICHLSISVALHVWMLLEHSHRALRIFPYGYSYAAAAYFGFFAWRSWTLRLRPA